MDKLQTFRDVTHDRPHVLHLSSWGSVLLYEHEVVGGVLNNNRPLPLDIVQQIEIADLHVDKIIVERPE